MQEAIRQVLGYRYRPSGGDGFVTDIRSDKTRIIQMTVWCACLASWNVRQSLTISLKFPAPVCNACGVPMVTVTMVFDHATPEAKKVISYHCQKCGSALGGPRRRADRGYLVLPFSHPPA